MPAAFRRTVQQRGNDHEKCEINERGFCLSFRFAPFVVSSSVRPSFTDPGRRRKSPQQRWEIDHEKCEINGKGILPFVLFRPFRGFLLRPTFLYRSGKRAARSGNWFARQPFEPVSSPRRKSPQQRQETTTKNAKSTKGFSAFRSVSPLSWFPPPSDLPLPIREERAARLLASFRPRSRSGRRVDLQPRLRRRGATGFVVFLRARPD